MHADERTLLLLVAGDEDLLVATAVQLTRRGYEVIPAMSGCEALAFLDQWPIELILIDVILPDCDGRELCQMLRDDRYGYQGPIIFMSSQGELEHVVEAFRKGCSDFMVKPVKLDALLERIELNLADSRSKRKKQSRCWYKQFMIDHRTHEVYRVEEREFGEKLELSPTEYKLPTPFDKAAG